MFNPRPPFTHSGSLPSTPTPFAAPSTSSPRLPIAERHMNMDIIQPSPSAPSSSHYKALPAPPPQRPGLPSRFDTQRYLLDSRTASRFFATTPSDEDMVDASPFSVPRAITVTRPSSLSEFSLIEPPVSFDDDRPSIYTPTCASAFATPSRQTLNGLGIGIGIRIGRTPSPAKGTLSRIWGAFSSPVRSTSRGRRDKGKGRPRTMTWFDDGAVDYSAMDPLDGEEGELIDEACYIDAPPVSGIDILSALPRETALQVLLFLDLPAVVACLAVSRIWRALAEDNAVWHALFAGRDGWRVDLARISQQRLEALGPAADVGNARRLSLKSVRSMGSIRSGISGISVRSKRAHSVAMSRLVMSAPAHRIPAPLMIDWKELYQTRLEIDRRWVTADPKMMRLSGHADSVYCLEFDSKRIITGSRDRTIKVWALDTGKLLGTFKGHGGSVLCLKFDQDWDLRGAGPGLLVSGSSDHTIKVWELHAGRGREGEVRAEPRAALVGHAGGVLDLRMDGEWIVSCSKDAVIRVWRRGTLEMHCELRGHEGPVNAVGLQSGRVVSASGDGKMMLWDVERGTRLRTFDGHDRGLACIEFKDDLIVSGSNDCKIKVWSASTGECLQTLSGHELLVRALAFDPESGRLVSASYDRTVKVWDLKTGRMVREFKASHVSHIFDVKFDVRRIVSTSHDQKIVVHDFAEGMDTSVFV